MAGAAIIRLVTCGWPPDTIPEAEHLLFDVLGRVPSNRAEKPFLLLPGGFIRAPWPDRWSGSTGWKATSGDVVEVEGAARGALQQLLSSRVRLRATRVRGIAIGVDSVCEASGAYAELVGFYDTQTRKTSFTGKSLPRSDQQKLVRYVDLSSHFVRVGSESVMLLGCHDLNLFSPRGRGRQLVGGHTAAVRAEMDARVARAKPHVVLQLPHGTDTARTWTASWNALLAQAPSIRMWASGISYYNIDGKPERTTLEDVLAKTRGGSCADVLYARASRST